MESYFIKNNYNYISDKLIKIMEKIWENKSNETKYLLFIRGPDSDQADLLCTPFSELKTCQDLIKNYFGDEKVSPIEILQWHIFLIVLDNVSIINFGNLDSLGNESKCFSNKIE